MDPSEAHSNRKVYTLTLKSPRAFESVLPPYPLAKLLLIVEIRTQEQGLTDPPVMMRKFSITGLLKPEFIDLPTDRIRTPHISFDSFCRKVEKASNIKFDAARDELGWVHEPLGPGDKQEYLAISSELQFQNALGMMRLSTTQSEPPQALILRLWSPAPKEPIFRRSRRAPVPKGRSVGRGLESEANLQQPLSSTKPPVNNLVLSPSTKEVNSPKPLGSTTPPIIDPALNQFLGAEADVEMTTLTTTDMSQSKLPRRSNSASGVTKQRDSKSKDQGLEDLNSALAIPAASTDYPHTDGQIQLNMGKLPDTLNPADIKGGDKQPDETEERY